MKKINKRTSLSFLRAQNGSITVQFVFAFMLVFGFIIGFFYLSLTLVVGELVQYATYSSSRYLSLSHSDPGAQKDVSQGKYNALLFSSGGGIFRSGFFGNVGADKPFNLDPLPMTNIGLNQTPGMPGMQLSRNLFYGVWNKFQPKGLSLKVPFWGDSVQGAQHGLFDSVISSYLGREPSQQECQDFIEARWRMIRDDIIGSSPPGGYSGSGGSNKYTYGGMVVNPYPDDRGSDNGC